jgi:hypothetical protein
MFEAANAGTLTISMLYLIEMDERDRELLVEYLRKRSHSIEFPKCMSEFFELVNTL